MCYFLLYSQTNTLKIILKINLHYKNINIYYPITAIYINTSSYRTCLSKHIANITLSRRFAYYTNTFFIYQSVDDFVCVC